MIAIVGDWRALLIRGVAAVAFGILTLTWPGLTLWALVLLWGAFVLVDGVATLAAVLTRQPGSEDDRGLLVLRGTVGIAAGIVTFVWPDITALALLFVIAAWAFVTGLVELTAAVRLRRVVDHAWLLGLAGVLSVVFAVVLVITPGPGALVITWLIGWYALVWGGVLLALAWRAWKTDTVLTAGAMPRPRSRPVPVRRVPT